jgi:hypothetical protein
MGLVDALPALRRTEKIEKKDWTHEIIGKVAVVSLIGVKPA